MSRLEDIKRRLDFGFRSRAIKPTQCIETTEAELFFIEDSKKEKQCVILKPNDVEDTPLNLFCVQNVLKKPIALLAIDGCFMKGKSSRCDCAFFDEDCFCFAELKFDSTTKSELQIAENRTKAVDQLRTTIQLFINALDNNFIGYRCEAYVCTPEHYPNKGTALDAFILEFLEDYGVDLYEKNEKIFL